MRALLAFGMLFSSLAFAVPSIKVGDKAPSLYAELWIRGYGISGFKKGQTYLIEFWGTWCKPCVKAIPHINEITKKYGEKLVVMGIAAREQGTKEEQKAALDKFLNSNDPIVEFQTGFDSTGELKKTWLDAAEVPGIPASFVIDSEGRIAFIGHPDELESEELGNPLEKIIKGEWMGSKEQLKRQADLVEQLLLEAKAEDFREKIAEAIRALDLNTAKNIAEIAEITFKNEPAYKREFGLQAVEIIITMENPVLAFAKLKPYIKESWDDLGTLYTGVWTLVHEKIPVGVFPLAGKFGRDIADRIVDLVENHPNPDMRAHYQKAAWYILPSVAKYYFKSNEVKLAIDTMEKALKSLPREKVQERTEMEAELRSYYKAADIKELIVMTTIANSNQTAADAKSVPAESNCKDGVCEIPQEEETNSCESGLESGPQKGK